MMSSDDQPLGRPPIARPVGVVSASDLAKLMGENLSFLAKSESAGQIFCLELLGEKLYPAFFADGRYPREYLFLVTKRLGKVSGGAKMQFFEQPKGSLGGISPLEALERGMLALVKRSADGFRER